MKLECETIDKKDQLRNFFLQNSWGVQFGLGLFRSLTFRQETFWHGHFITGTFRHGDFSVPWTFRHMDILSPWTFRHRDISAWGQNGTGTFWHRNISTHGCFGTGKFRHHAKQYGHRQFGTCAEMWYCAKTSILPKYPCAEMFQCQNVPVPKDPHAEISRCRNIPVPKNSFCRKIHVPNNLLAEMSMETKCPHAEMILWWNICAKMSLAEMSGSEIIWSLQFNLSIWLTLVRSWKPFVASRGSSKSIRSRLLTTKKKYDPWGSVQLVQKWFHLFWKNLKWQQISICKCEK